MNCQARSASSARARAPRLTALPPSLNQDKLSEAALAILGLSAFRDHQTVRAWKGIDWDLLDALYQRGWIADPKGKAKSVVFDESARPAQDLLARRFAK